MTEAERKRAAARASVQEMLDLFHEIRRIQNYTGYDVELLSNIHLIDAMPEGKVIWELEMTPFYGNNNGVMHGGAAGVIFDMATTAALCPVQKPGYWDFLGGVTRSLNLSYLKAVPINSTVRIVATLVQHGRTMAMIRGTMESLDGKTIYATCEHHKVHVPILPAHIDIREAMRAQKREAAQKPKL